MRIGTAMACLLLLVSAGCKPLTKSNTAQQFPGEKAAPEYAKTWEYRRRVRRERTAEK